MPFVATRYVPSVGLVMVFNTSVCVGAGAGAEEATGGVATGEDGATLLAAGLYAGAYEEPGLIIQYTTPTIIAAIMRMSATR